MSEVPEIISSAIEELWRVSSTNESAVFSSPAFTKLEDSCFSVYRSIPGSQLDQKPINEEYPSELNTVLRNFFRWNGGPWNNGNALNASEAAQLLHQAFLSKRFNRYYLVPLDRFYLHSNSLSSHEDTITDVSFGPNKIACLNSIELDKLVRAQALPRFGSNCIFPTRELDNFFWLLVTCNEVAPTIWSRHGLRIKRNLSLLIPGTVSIFQPIFPTPIEDALFAMLLTFVKKLNNPRWKPFYVPWFYSFTDDSFADATHAPDPSALTRIDIFDPDKDFQVPDRSIKFSVNSRKRKALKQRWCKLQACLHRVDSGRQNFNLLTKRFFVKGLVDNGIDQLISNVSCIEATLQLQTEKNRSNLMKRFLYLTGDVEAYKWLEITYKLRNQYLHGLDKSKNTLSWEELAKARWSLTKAMKKYLDLTDQHSELDRSDLLQLLLSDEPHKKYLT